MSDLRRTNADKRRAVETLLADEEWSRESVNWIAKTAGVDHKTVAGVRADLGIPKSPVRTTSDGRVMNTANIGRRLPKPHGGARGIVGVSGNRPAGGCNHATKRYEE